MVNNLHRKQIKVGDLGINYYTGGHGEPLIVIHGGASSAEAWMENLAELARNHTIYVPDLPGFGRSQPMNGDCYIPELVAFVDEFACALGLEKFHLVGHSLGGGVALSYVLRFPQKIMKLVLVSSMCMGREVALWVRFLSCSPLVRSIGAVATGIMRGVKWVAERLFSGLEFIPPLSRTSIDLGSSMTTLREQTTVLVNQLSEIMVLTLVVWGANDSIVPVKHAYTAGKLIPTCKVKVFEGCGHSVYRQRILEFSILLIAFLG